MYGQKEQTLSEPDHDRIKTLITTNYSDQLPMTNIFVCGFVRIRRL